jgi:flagellar assembly factor FliW
MKMETTRFGEIEINEQEIITFPDGIPGFERDRRFVILELEDLDGFACLQCIDRGELSFIIVNPFVFFPEYEFNLPDAEAQQLEIAEPGDVAVWSIVTIRDELESATVNLVAPIVLNRQKRLGKQVILVDPNLSTRHALFRTAEEV